jgi:protein gp37
MNKTQIEWCDYTWNPVTGCKHQCRDVYCYNTMKRTAPLNRFGAKYKTGSNLFIREKNWRSRETGKNHTAEKGEVYPFGYDPTFYPHRLQEPYKVRKSSKIFVVDTGDLFGSWVPREWIEKVLQVAVDNPHHTFQFLTKNPERMMDFNFPQNAWAGTSINTNSDKSRANTIKKVDATVSWISIEPLRGPVEFDFSGLQWIVIGAQTGRNAVIPQDNWIDNILENADNLSIPVFMKFNLRPHYSGNLVQNFPTITAVSSNFIGTRD